MTETATSEVGIIQLGCGVQVESSTSATNARIEGLTCELMEAVLKGDLQEADCPLEHIFTPGVYIREITMPAGAMVIGHEHKGTHLNVVTKGAALVMIGGESFLLEAPHSFVSEQGVRKVLFIFEEMKFMTIHPNPTEERDIEKLEEEILVKTPFSVQYKQDVKRLREIVAKSALSSHEQSPAIPTLS